MISQEEEVTKLIQRAMLSRATSLNLEEYKLTNLPESLINIPNLRHLNLDIDLLDDLSILQNTYSLSTVTFLRDSRVYLPRD